MSDRQSLKPMDANTRALIQTVLTEFMGQRRCFFALEVSNAVKERGVAMTPPQGYGRHGEMAPVMRDLLAQGALTGYEAVLVPVNNGADQAFLYQPVGTDPQETLRHHNRTVTAVEPVDVLLAQQAATPQAGRARRMQAVRQEVARQADAPATAATADAAAAVTDPRLALLGGHVLAATTSPTRKPAT